MKHIYEWSGASSLLRPGCSTPLDPYIGCHNWGKRWLHAWKWGGSLRITCHGAWRTFWVAAVEMVVFLFVLWGCKKMDKASYTQTCNHDMVIQVCHCLPNQDDVTERWEDLRNEKEKAHDSEPMVSQKGSPMLWQMIVFLSVRMEFIPHVAYNPKPTTLNS